MTRMLRNGRISLVWAVSGALASALILAGPHAQAARLQAPEISVSTDIECFDASSLADAVAELRDAAPSPEVPIEVELGATGLRVRLFWQGQLQSERVFTDPPRDCEQQLLVVAVALAVALDDTWDTQQAEQRAIALRSPASNRPVEIAPTAQTEPHEANRARRRRTRPPNGQTPKRLGLATSGIIGWGHQPSVLGGGELRLDLQLAPGFRLGLAIAGQGRHTATLDLARVRLAVFDAGLQGCGLLGGRGQNRLRWPICLGLRQGASYFLAPDLPRTEALWQYWLAVHADANVEIRLRRSLRLTLRTRVNFTPFVRKFLATRDEEPVLLTTTGLWGPEFAIGLRFSLGSQD